MLAELIFQRETDSSLESTHASPLARQRTVTLDTQEEEEGKGEESASPSSSSRQLSAKEEEGEEEEDVKEEEEVTPRRRIRKDREIAENIDVLRSLLMGHLSRQREVNHLLTRAPLLVGEGQGASGRNPKSPKEGRKGKSEAGGGGQTRSPRHAPEGEEGAGRAGGGLVRQGTFNVDEEGEGEGEDGPVDLNATLDGHLTRTKAVKQLK